MTANPFAIAACLILVASPAASARNDRTNDTADSAPGRRTLTFAERHPLGGPEEVSRRTGMSRSRPPGMGEEKPWEYDLQNESFEVFLPATYKPGVPHGLLVWIPPGRAELPRGYFDAFARHKVIWVSANDSGNGRGYGARCGLALDAVHNVTRRYAIDPKRVYVSGFSNGAGLAGDLVHGYPEVFTGAYCIAQGAFVAGRRTEDGRFEAGIQSVEWKGPIDRIKKEMKLVLMNGEKDQQTLRGGTRAVYEALLLDGFERVSFFEVPNWPHRLPPLAWFDRGLAALEADPKKPPTTAPTKDPKPLPGQVAVAKRILVTARSHLDHKRPEWARKHLKRLIDEYPTTPAAAEARAILEALDAEAEPAKPAE